MKKQETKFRVVILNEEKAGLYWHMEWDNGELYYGFSHEIGEVLRGSYHKDGTNFFHILQNSSKKFDRQSKWNKGTRLDSLKEPLRIVGASDSIANIKWNYRIKKDTLTRKTLVLDQEAFADNFSPSVDLWAIPNKREDLVDYKIEEYQSREDIILGTLASKLQNPILLVVVWKLSKGATLAFENSIGKVHGR